MSTYLKEKIVLHGENSREAILRGIDLLADAVKVTLGPKGRNVVIGRRYFGLDPQVTKDGVTVANVVNPTDVCEQIGADLIRSAAQKTVEAAGDGTTTSVVLAQAMLHAGFEALKTGGSPIAIKRGMDRACEAITAALRKMSVPVAGEMALQVANISANGDQAIATIVAKAIETVGKDGVVAVEESRTLETHLETVAGMELRSGFVSPYFITNPQTMKCELNDCLVLLWEGKIATSRSLVPLLNIIKAANKPLLLIGGDFEHEAIATLIANMDRVRTCAVTTGAFGDRRRELLGDIAVLTGGAALTEDVGRKIENVTADDLGQAQKVIVSETKTVIVAEPPDDIAYQGRVARLRRGMELAEGVEKSHLQVRLAGLTGGIAVIKVGAATEVEMKEKKDRVEDAMYATKAAVEEGVVPGGGVALLRACESWSVGNWSPNEAMGGAIVEQACWKPLMQIVSNAGGDSQTIATQVRHEKSGWNAATGEFCDLAAAGVLDPTKVVIEALKNAVSIAGMILTTEAMVAEVLEERP